MSDVVNDPSDLIEQLEEENDLLEFQLAKIEGMFIPTIPGVVVHRRLHGEDPIKVWREYRGLSVSALAEMAHLPEAIVLEAETGSPIDRRVLGRLAEALETTADELIPRLHD